MPLLPRPQSSAHHHDRGSPHHTLSLFSPGPLAGGSLNQAGVVITVRFLSIRTGAHVQREGWSLSLASSYAVSLASHDVRRIQGEEGGGGARGTDSYGPHVLLSGTRTYAKYLEHLASGTACSYTMVPVSKKRSASRGVGRSQFDLVPTAVSMHALGSHHLN